MTSTEFLFTAFGHQMSIEPAQHENTVRIDVDGKYIELTYAEAAQLEAALLKARSVLSVTGDRA